MSEPQFIRTFPDCRLYTKCKIVMRKTPGRFIHEKESLPLARLLHLPLNRLGFVLLGLTPKMCQNSIPNGRISATITLDF